MPMSDRTFNQSSELCRLAVVYRSGKPSPVMGEEQPDILLLCKLGKEESEVAVL
jgi:hypothetical protein